MYYKLIISLYSKELDCVGNTLLSHFAPSFLASNGLNYLFIYLFFYTPIYLFEKKFTVEGREN